MELSKQGRKIQKRKTLPWTSAALVRSHQIPSGSYMASMNQAPSHNGQQSHMGQCLGTQGE